MKDEYFLFTKYFVGRKDGKVKRMKYRNPSPLFGSREGCEERC